VFNRNKALLETKGLFVCKLLIISVVTKRKALDCARVQIHAIGIVNP